jgi:glyoxylase-like metal-dependent hydrolase (beta-lactamase superfamily II)
MSDIDQYEPKAGCGTEGETQPAEEPHHPGWLSLGEILQTPHPMFAKSVFLIGYHFSCTIYVLGGAYTTVVDPGNDYTGLLDLFRRGTDPGSIRKIVLTHGHRDHAMGTFELLRYLPATGEKELEIILHAAGPEEFKGMIRETGHRLVEVRGGETLDLSGFPWQVIHTPGHTIDGITLYHETTKTALTGDVILPHAMADIDKNAGGRMDHYLYAVRTLLKKDIRTVLPGHGVPVATDGRTAIEQTYEGLMMKIIGTEGPVPWLEGAKALAQRGLLEEAIFCCNKELASRPESPTALQLKALSLDDLGRCEESVAVFDTILARQGTNPQALLGKGHALLGLGKYGKSVEYFDRALGLAPDLQEAHIFKGMALYLSGRYDEAMDIEAFRREFAGRFKEQLERRSQEPKGDSGRSS